MPAINRMCADRNVFQADRAAIKEYLVVMQPVVDALNIVQREDATFAGILWQLGKYLSRNQIHESIWLFLNRWHCTPQSLFCETLLSTRTASYFD